LKLSSGAIARSTFVGPVGRSNGVEESVVAIRCAVQVEQTAAEEGPPEILAVPGGFHRRKQERLRCCNAFQRNAISLETGATPAVAVV